MYDINFDTVILISKMIDSIFITNDNMIVYNVYFNLLNHLNH